MFVDISPPAGTRVVDAQVTRGRRHGPGRAGDSGAAEELRARGQRLKDMDICSHKYAVYAYDTG